MSDQQACSPADRFTVKVAAKGHFAWLRTQLALENTMLAWVCTAVSMTAFVIVQFFDKLHKLPGDKTVLLPNAPWLLELALIFCSVLVFVIARWEYRWTRRYLESGAFAAIADLMKKRMHTPVYTSAIVLMLIGIVSFFAVLLHLV